MSAAPRRRCPTSFHHKSCYAPGKLQIQPSKGCFRRPDRQCGRQLGGCEGIHAFSTEPVMEPYSGRNMTLATSSILLRTRKNSLDRKSTRLNSSHMSISYAVFCLKKKKKKKNIINFNN